MLRRLLLTLVGMCAISSAQPRIFFTDILDGPNSGGENGDGAVIHVYGSGFTDSMTITLNGVEATRYYDWTSASMAVPASATDRATTWLHYQKAAFQIGSGHSSGNIVVTTTAGTSNTVAFSVRAGNIRCVKTTGSDASNGTYAAGCWATITQGYEAMGDSNLLYVHTGVAATAQHNWDAALAMNYDSANHGGTASSYRAILGYPGAMPQIGRSASGTPSYGIRVANVSGSANYVVIANFNIRSGGSAGVALANSHHWRLVGNNIQCPNIEQGCWCACVHHHEFTDSFIHGNYVGNVAGASTSTKNNHIVYASTNSSRVDVGWNEIDGSTGNSCRGFQAHSSAPGVATNGIRVHDNYIHDTRCDAINYATVDPGSDTTVKSEVFNNLLVNVGRGVMNGDASAYMGIFNQAFCDGCTHTFTGTLDIYNNTIYNAGGAGNSQHGALSNTTSQVAMRLRNNIVRQQNARPYISTATGVTGSNNLWHGSGTAPAATSANVTSDPLFVTEGSNFKLQATSPAKDAGVSISGLTYDLAGISRPQGSALDIGAYEIDQGETPPPSPTYVPLRITGSASVSGKSSVR